MLKRLMWFAGYVISPVLAISGALLLTGCSVSDSSRRPPIEVWDDMDRQEKFKAQSSVGKDLYGMFSDRRSNRRPPEGTIATVGAPQECNTAEVFNPRPPADSPIDWI